MQWQCSYPCSGAQPFLRGDMLRPTASACPSSQTLGPTGGAACVALSMNASTELCLRFAAGPGRCRLVAIAFPCTPLRLASQRFTSRAVWALRPASVSTDAPHSFRSASALEAPTRVNVGQLVGASAEGGVEVAALADAAAPPVSFGVRGPRSKCNSSAATHAAGPNPSIEGTRSGLRPPRAPHVKR
jgi:hypothetical protein